MKFSKLLMSTLALAFLASPVFAQDADEQEPTVESAKMQLSDCYQPVVIEYSVQRSFDTCMDLVPAYNVALPKDVAIVDAEMPFIPNYKTILSWQSIKLRWHIPICIGEPIAMSKSYRAPPKV